MYAFLFKSPNPHGTVVLLGETSVEVKVNISLHAHLKHPIKQS